MMNQKKKKIEMTKKAQTATEFLIGYGWMILIVLILVGGLAYFGAFNKDIVFFTEDCAKNFCEEKNLSYVFYQSPNIITCDAEPSDDFIEYKKFGIRNITKVCGENNETG